MRIEYPCSGATYCEAKYGVYEYSVYPNSSVLAGQQRRVFLDSFNTLEEAKEADQAEYEAWLDAAIEDERNSRFDYDDDSEAEAEMSRYDDDPSPYDGTYSEWDGE